MDETQRSLNRGSHVNSPVPGENHPGRWLRGGRADGFTDVGSVAFPVCKDQQRELHKCWDQAQEREGREEPTLLLGSCLGNRVGVGQQTLPEVIEGSRMWREKVSQEHGGVKEINTIISPATF